MIATAKLRRRAGQRISSALWALLVIGAGVLMIATLSGHDIDLQLILIIVLGALGVWLLLSAAVSGIGRQKQVARATAPVVEEPAPPTEEDPAVNKSDSAKAEQAAEPVATSQDEVPAGASQALKPDSVSKRAAAAKRKPNQSKSTKPATRKPANKKSANSKSADDPKPAQD